MGESLLAEMLKIMRWGNSLRTPRSVTVGVLWAKPGGDETWDMRHEARSARVMEANRAVRALKCAAPPASKVQRVNKPPTLVGGRPASSSLSWPPLSVTEGGFLVGALQVIEVSVEDGFGVAGLEAGAVVFHHLIRMEDVG